MTCEGKSALHLACHHVLNVSRSTARWLLQTCPFCVRSANICGALPLYYLAYNARNVVDVLKLLSTEFTIALQIENGKGDLTLHISVMAGGVGHEGGAVENLQFLLEAFPDAARRTNARKELSG